jgi:Flp pilus assembly pilin Flp
MKRRSSFCFLQRELLRTRNPCSQQLPQAMQETLFTTLVHSYWKSHISQPVAGSRLHCKTIVACEEGQGTVEYALVVALIAFGAVLGMKGFASGVNSALNKISSTLTADV